LTAYTTPSITIVLPVWDAYVHRLPEALASIQSQDASAKIILVDNASRTRLPPLDPGGDEIEVVRSGRRLTAGGARNLGLSAVGTSYVIFWDADDEMCPGTLRLLHESIEQDQGLTTFVTAILESRSGPRHRWPRLWMRGLARLPRVFALANAVWPLYPTTGSAIMRTSLVKDAGGCADLDRGEDALLAASLAFRGRVGFSPHPGRIYRRHARSLSADALSLRESLAQRRAVRMRLREDRGVPAFAKRLLPAIALLQFVAVFLLRPAIIAARGAKRRAGSLTRRAEAGPGSVSAREAKR
jgi:glycosyltransferase involved in cell wall biosynthesis